MQDIIPSNLYKILYDTTKTCSSYIIFFRFLLVFSEKYMFSKKLNFFNISLGFILHGIMRIIACGDKLTLTRQRLIIALLLSN